MATDVSFQVALEGFSEFERQALGFCFIHAVVREPHYVLTANLAEADLVVVDADSAAAVRNVIQGAATPGVVFVGKVAPVGAPYRVGRPIDSVKILRCLDDVVAEHGVALRARAAPVAVRAAPTAAPAAVPTLALSDAVAVTEPAAHAPDQRADAKAKARRAARRARQDAAASEFGVEAMSTDVLVLDRHDAPREWLCALLKAFGFTVYPASTLEQAGELLRFHQFAAAFLGIVLDASDGGEGVALCRMARDFDSASLRWVQALVVVSDKPAPADPVRARLAGADAHLVKPLARGDVVRALESCGVVLPVDARA